VWVGSVFHFFSLVFSFWFFCLVFFFFFFFPFGFFPLIKGFKPRPFFCFLENPKFLSFFSFNFPRYFYGFFPLLLDFVLTLPFPFSGRRKVTFLHQEPAQRHKPPLPFRFLWLFFLKRMSVTFPRLLDYEKVEDSFFPSPLLLEVLDPSRFTCF